MELLKLVSKNGKLRPYLKKAIDAQRARLWSGVFNGDARIAASFNEPAFGVAVFNGNA